MDSDVYRLAKKREASLTEELNTVRRWITTYEEFAAQLQPGVKPPPPTQAETPARPEDSDATEASSRTALQSSDAPKTSRAGRRAEIIEAVTAALIVEQPLKTKEIYERLKARGVEVGGSDPAHNLLNYLGREKQRFEAHRGKGWFLVEKAQPSPSLGRTPAVESSQHEPNQET